MENKYLINKTNKTILNHFDSTLITDKIDVIINNGCTQPDSANRIIDGWEEFIVSFVNDNRLTNEKKLRSNIRQIVIAIVSSSFSGSALTEFLDMAEHDDNNQPRYTSYSDSSVKYKLVPLSKGGGFKSINSRNNAIQYCSFNTALDNIERVIRDFARPNNTNFVLVLSLVLGSYLKSKDPKIVSKLVDEIYDAVLESEDTDLIVNYSVNKHILPIDITVSDSMKQLNHFRNKTTTRVNMSVYTQPTAGLNPRLNEMRFTLNGINFKDYDTSFGIQDVLSDIVGVVEYKDTHDETTAVGSPSIYSKSSKYIKKLIAFVKDIIIAKTIEYNEIDCNPVITRYLQKLAEIDNTRLSKASSNEVIERRIFNRNNMIKRSTMDGSRNNSSIFNLINATIKTRYDDEIPQFINVVPTRQSIKGHMEKRVMYNSNDIKFALIYNVSSSVKHILIDEYFWSSIANKSIHYINMALYYLPLIRYSHIMNISKCMTNWNKSSISNKINYLNRYVDPSVRLFKSTIDMETIGDNRYTLAKLNNVVEKTCSELLNNDQINELLSLATMFSGIFRKFTMQSVIGQTPANINSKIYTAKAKNNHLRISDYYTNKDVNTLSTTTTPSSIDNSMTLYKLKLRMLAYSIASNKLHNLTKSGKIFVNWLIEDNLINYDRDSIIPCDRDTSDSQVNTDYEIFYMHKLDTAHDFLQYLYNLSNCVNEQLTNDIMRGINGVTHTVKRSLNISMIMSEIYMIDKKLNNPEPKVLHIDNDSFIVDYNYSYAMGRASDLDSEIYGNEITSFMCSVNRFLEAKHNLFFKIKNFYFNDDINNDAMIAKESAMLAHVNKLTNTSDVFMHNLALSMSDKYKLGINFIKAPLHNTIFNYSKLEKQINNFYLQEDKIVKVEFVSNKEEYVRLGNYFHNCVGGRYPSSNFIVINNKPSTIKINAFTFKLITNNKSDDVCCQLVAEYNIETKQCTVSIYEYKSHSNSPVSGTGAKHVNEIMKKFIHPNIISTMRKIIGDETDIKAIEAKINKINNHYHSRNSGYADKMANIFKRLNFTAPMACDVAHNMIPMIDDISETLETLNSILMHDKASTKNMKLWNSLSNFKI